MSSLGCIVSGEEVTMLDPGVDNWWWVMIRG